MSNQRSFYKVMCVRLFSDSVSYTKAQVDRIIKISLSVHTSRYRTNERLSCQGISEEIL